MISENTSIPIFIEKLRNLYSNNHPCLNFISNYDSLIENLYKLEELIGMNSFKKQIVSLLQFVIVNSYNSVFDEKRAHNLLDGHMINMVLSGPPGCGKTSAGKIISSIIGSLGVFKKKSPMEKLDEIENIRIEKPIFKPRMIKNFIAAHILEIELEKRKRNKVVESVKKICKLLENTDKQLELTFDDLCEQCNCDERQKRKYQRKRYNIKRCVRDLQNCIPHKPIKTIWNEEDKKDEIPFFVYNRADLIAEYLGQTSIKTLNALEKARGGVILIDEAYNLYNDEDPYGIECLTTLNQFISENPEEIVVIFAGYKDKLESGIFKAQPGLKRRVGWIFDIEPYSSHELYLIFKSQIEKVGWKINTDERIFSFFERYKTFLPYSGGDTEKLALYCKNIAYSSLFDQISDANCEKLEHLITYEILEEAIQLFKENTVEKSTPPPYMYI
jgi:DNA polymerase III delta prime subunit